MIEAHPPMHKLVEGLASQRLRVKVAVPPSKVFECGHDATSSEVWRIAMVLHPLRRWADNDHIGIED